MKLKNTLIYLGILAALIIVLVVERGVRERRTELEEKEKKVFTVDRPNLKQIKLARGGETVLLDRDRADWEIIEPIRTASDENVVEQIIIHLEDLEVQRSVIDTVADLAPFGLESPAVEIGFYDSLADKWETLAIGDENPTGSNVYASASTRPGVFLLYTSEKTFFDKGLLDLRDKRVLRFEKSDVRGLDLIRGSESLSFNRSENDLWYLTEPIETKANKNAIEDILTKLDDGKAKSFEVERSTNLKAYDLDPPEVSVKLYVGPDRTMHNLLIGKRTIDGYYAKDASRDQVVTVDTSLVAELKKSVFELRNTKALDFVTYRTKKASFRYGDLALVAERDTADDWWIVDPLRAEGSNSDINEVLYDLQDLKAESFAADKPADLARYHLEEPAGTIEIWPEEADSAQVLLIGGKAGSSDRRYVKNADEPSVMVVDAEFLASLEDKSVDDFRKRDLFDFMSYNLKLLRFAEGNQATELRKRNNNWQLIEPDSKDLDYTDASDAISDLEDVKIARFVLERVDNLDRYGLRNPQGTITVRWGDENREQVLEIGSDEDDMVYVKRRDLDNLWQINKEDLDTFKNSLRRLVKLG